MMSPSFEFGTPGHPQIGEERLFLGSHPLAVPNSGVADWTSRLTRLSRSCYKAQMARIAFYVSAAEFKEIAELAGDVPLSKWCRKKVMERVAVPVNEQAGQDRKKRLPRAETVSAVSGGFDTPVRVAPSVAHCEHLYAANECPYASCKNFKRRM